MLSCWISICKISNATDAAGQTLIKPTLKHGGCCGLSCHQSHTNTQTIIRASHIGKLIQKNKIQIINDNIKTLSFLFLNCAQLEQLAFDQWRLWYSTAQHFFNRQTVHVNTYVDDVTFFHQGLDLRQNTQHAAHAVALWRPTCDLAARQLQQSPLRLHGLCGYLQCVRDRRGIAFFCPHVCPRIIASVPSPVNARPLSWAHSRMCLWRK